VVKYIEPGAAGAGGWGCSARHVRRGPYPERVRRASSGEAIWVKNSNSGRANVGGPMVPSSTVVMGRLGCGSLLVYVAA